VILRHTRKEEPEPVVAIVQASLLVPGCQSLKEKRSVVRGLVERCRNRFNASVAEVGSLDLLQRTEIAAAIVTNDRKAALSQAEAVLDHLRGCPDANLVDHRIDIV
jgi:uncharacterized protein YlxP (DUF503 family)